VVKEKDKEGNLGCDVQALLFSHFTAFGKESTELARVPQMSLEH